MKISILFLFFLSFQQLKAQELFAYTEPASNMAAKSIGLRLNNHFMKESVYTKYDYHLIPELMWGISKRIMIHGEGFFSNSSNSFKAEGGSLYAKYRFYSRDEVHSHFRMAATIKGAINNGHIHQPAIDMNGLNSGYEAGIIATKLINKVALSLNASFLHATDNSAGNKFLYGDQNRNALAYAFSTGALILPKTYASYEQTNMNMMLELLGQTNLKSGKNYLDLAPSIQFIFLSKMRLDLGYRFALAKELVRANDQGFLVRFEYNFFSVYK